MDFKFQDTVAEVVTGHPHLARVFERFGVDYCCGGEKTLQEVCVEKGLDPQLLLAALHEFSSEEGGEEADLDVMTFSLAELADHIEATHHTYLRSELPRLDALTRKVSSVHGSTDPRLVQIRKTFLQLAGELYDHMRKEEQILFPLVRELEAGEGTFEFHCGSLANPIRQMEWEHDQAASALNRLRELTEEYRPPDWACNTYRAMLDALSRLERDLHRHIHKENNVLFPRALEEERRRQAQ